MRSIKIFFCVLIILQAMPSHALEKPCIQDGIWRYDVDTSIRQTQWLRSGGEEITELAEALNSVLGPVEITPGDITVEVAGNKKKYESTDYIRNRGSIRLPIVRTDRSVLLIGCDHSGIYAKYGGAKYGFNRVYYTQVR